MKKYKIELDERQLGVVCDALDLYARVGMGQWEALLHFVGQYVKVPDRIRPYENTYARLRTWIEAIKEDAFDLAPNASNGIHNQVVPHMCREAWDIRQVLTTTTTVLPGRPYMATNKDWPPVTCEKISEE